MKIAPIKAYTGISSNHNINFKRGYHGYPDWINAKQALRNNDNRGIEELCKEAPWTFSEVFYFNENNFKDLDIKAVKKVLNKAPQEMKNMAFQNRETEYGYGEKSTMFHTFASQNSEIFKAFCEAFPEESLKALSKKDDLGNTPITFANTETLKFLIDNYKDVVRKEITEQNCNGITIVHNSAFSAPARLKMLVDNYPEEVRTALNIRSKNGNTPFHELGHQKGYESAKILVANYPKEVKKALTSQNNMGETPVHLAAFSCPKALKLFYREFPNQFEEAMKIKADSGKNPVNYAFAGTLTQESIDFFYEIAPKEAQRAEEIANSIYAYLMPQTPMINYCYRY